MHQRARAPPPSRGAAGDLDRRHRQATLQRTRRTSRRCAAFARPVHARFRLPLSAPRRPSLVLPRRHRCPCPVAPHAARPSAVVLEIGRRFWALAVRYGYGAAAASSTVVWRRRPSFTRVGAWGPLVLFILVVSEKTIPRPCPLVFALPLLAARAAAVSRCYDPADSCLVRITLTLYSPPLPPADCAVVLGFAVFLFRPIIQNSARSSSSFLPARQFRLPSLPRPAPSIRKM